MDCCTDTHMITGEVVNDPLSYDCSICRETLPSQPELNAHLYSHFEIRSCKRCNKSILVIGDLEFEFHRPRNCTGLDETSSKSNVSCFSEYLDDIDCKQNSLQAKIGDKQISCSRSRFPRTLDHTLGIFKLKWGVNDLETKDNEMKTEAELENDMTANETDLKLEPLSPERNVSAGNVRRVEAPSLRADNESDPELETAPEPEEFVMATRKRNRPLPKTIPCPDCGELFRHERTVKSHRRKMHGYREEIKCHICSREFNHTGTLQQHIRTHSDSYRYICCYCGKGFHMPNNMTEHMNTHTGERPHKCTVCEKTFNRRSLLLTHMRVHTGEKPYKCNIDNCTRAYSQQTDLKRHKRSSHGIIGKTFTCPICSKIFYENKFLTKHLTMHQGTI